jgi:hypothetical protein
MMTPPFCTEFPLSARLVCHAWRDDHDERIAQLHPDLRKVFKTILRGQHFQLFFEDCYRLVYTNCVTSRKGTRNVLLTLRSTATLVTVPPEDVAWQVRLISDVCMMVTTTHHNRHALRLQALVRDFLTR